jgi:hypothetical protein
VYALVVRSRPALLLPCDEWRWTRYKQLRGTVQVQGISFLEDMMMRRRKLWPASPCGFISRRCHFRGSLALRAGAGGGRKRKGGKRLSASAASSGAACLLQSCMRKWKEGRRLAGGRQGAAAGPARKPRAREEHAKLPGWLHSPPLARWGVNTPLIALAPVRCRRHAPI